MMLHARPSSSPDTPRLAAKFGLTRCLLFVLLVVMAGAVAAESDHHISGVERVVAVGDLHGDWNGYMATLRAAGLVDRRGSWKGGEAHLVQTGDIPDRGPDTRRIIEHMSRLAREAERAGGRVHNLMGNHEAMNVYGDLRYVTPGEYAEWADRNSGRLRERYLDALLDRLQDEDPDRFEALPDDFRAQWKAAHPEGWLEHRYAWSPSWDPEGDMYQWVRDQRVAIRIDETLFVHGGISAAYCNEALVSWTQRAREALAEHDRETLGILVDPLGPLWYRGLSGVEPQATAQAVDAILDRYDAEYIVVGHTPTGGVVWPRYGGRVTQIDTGISQAYGGHIGYLEITAEGRFAGYRDGRIELPEDESGLADYARAVAELHDGDEELTQRLIDLQAETLQTDAPPPPGDGDTSDETSGEEDIAEPVPLVSCDRPR